jgi:hypothetical protein
MDPSRRQELLLSVQPIPSGGNNRALERPRVVHHGVSLSSHQQGEGGGQGRKASRSQPALTPALCLPVTRTSSIALWNAQELLPGRLHAAAHAPYGGTCSIRRHMLHTAAHAPYGGTCSIRRHTLHTAAHAPYGGRYIHL